VDDSETLTHLQIQHEEIMLRLRLREGLPLDVLTTSATAQAELAVSQGLLEPERFTQGTAVLTFQGRLLADGLVARLWG
jgi:oxygen-independent coproporphyrinogen-3 oxidase